MSDRVDVTKETLDLLGEVATATLSTQLRRRGLGAIAMIALRSTRPDLRLVGRARTLRYLPLREDVAAEKAMSAQRQLVEAIEPGDVLLIDARGDLEAGVIGDISALRVERRGAHGIVTDGALRDSAVIGALSMPVYFRTTHPSAPTARHVPWDSDLPIACGGVLVVPGDVIVGDADGVVVIPPRIAGEVAADAAEQELEERFVADRVAEGEALPGLFPMSETWRTSYEAWRAAELQ